LLPRVTRRYNRICATFGGHDATPMPVYALGTIFGFPDPEKADSSGLLAVGGDLRPERVLLAYANGIFPWPIPGLPLAWFSPPERMVLAPEAVHVSRRLRGYLANHPYRLSADTAFDTVIARCGEPDRRREASTWITPEMAEAYRTLHRLGFAHSIEAWRGDELVGGIYGVSIGGVFSGESMFYDEPNASKLAFVALARQLARWDFDLLDCQVHTPHVARLGARLIPRSAFLETLRASAARPTRRGPWTLDRDDAG
jgi:leucyl/phenylalanyl-tRNA--protein transferase